MSKMFDKIKSHLVDKESSHRKIAVGLIWVSFFVAIGKLAGAAKEMTIAWRYGVSETVDAYVFLYNLITWPVSIWFSVVTAVLVPLVIDHEKQRTDELAAFMSELFGMTILIGVSLSIISLLFLPNMLQAGLLGLSGSAQLEAVRMAAPLALIALMGTIISYFSACLLAAGHHKNTLFEAIPALSILIVLLFPPHTIPQPLVLGTVVGFMLHMIALAIPLKFQNKLQYPHLKISSPLWKKFLGGIGLMLVGQVLMSLTNIVDQFVAARLDQGTLANINYANRVLSLILGLGAIAISRATLPIFSQFNASGDYNTRQAAFLWAKWMFILGFLISIVGIIAAPHVVNLLFQRGAFTKEDSDNVGEVLRYAMLQVPFFAFTITLVNLFASQKKYSILLISGGIGLGVKLVTTVAFVPLMHANGLMLSTAAVYLANGFYFYIQAKGRK